MLDFCGQTGLKIHYGASMISTFPQQDCHTIHSFSLVDNACAFFPKALLMKVMGLRDCIKATPILLSRASVSATKVLKSLARTLQELSNVV